MKLHLRNINIVKEADVEIKGLTVIAGENSTGKSTVGKCLYSIVKALISTFNHDEKEVRSLIGNHLDAFVQQLPKNLDYSRSQYLSHRKDFIEHFYNKAIQMDGNERLEIKDLMDGLKQYLGIKGGALSPAMINRLKMSLFDLYTSIHTSNTGAFMLSEFAHLTHSEFRSVIKAPEGDVSEIALDNDIDESVKIDLSKKSVHFEGEWIPIFRDITYVESPLYMHLFERLYNYSLSVDDNTIDKFSVPFHVIDLVRKLESIRMASDSLSEDSIVDEISEIIGATFDYNGEAHALMAHKNDMDIYPVNMASGVKSFGVLQVLDRIGLLNGFCPLIWDEPENHLHPSWQVKMAEVMVRLAKRGVPIMVSTHSPYFLQGVRYFAAKYDLDEYTKYYFARLDDDGFASFEDLGSDLRPVFTHLSSPLHDIMNVDAVRTNNE